MAPRKRTWGAALDRYPRDTKPADSPRLGRRWFKRPRRRPRRIIRRKRFLRRNRPFRVQQKPPPGWVTIQVKATVPERLKLRIDQLATYDDRSRAELVILGLTWVVTEWAAKRLPLGAETLESIQAYRQYHVQTPRNPGRPKPRKRKRRRMYIRKETVEKLENASTTKVVEEPSADPV